MKLNKRILACSAVATVLLVAGAAQSVQPPAHVIDSQPAKTPAPEQTSKPERSKVELPPALPPAAKSAPAKDPVQSQRADEALAQLKAGNERWVSGNVTNPNISTQRRQEVTENGQKPFATIFTCADSRLPVERIFDRGVGDIFVTRIAGNVVADTEAGTIEYAVEHLKTPLLVIMGHTKCGAVAAAVANQPVHGKIAALVTSIRPAVERATRNNPRATPEELARIAVKENVWQSIFDLLKSSDVVREKLAAGQIRIIGAVCDISTGKVEWMGEHPWQAELVNALETHPANTAQVEEK